MRPAAPAVDLLSSSLAIYIDACPAILSSRLRLTLPMPKLFINMSTEQANLCAVVLSSSGVPYYSTEGGEGWEIWVKDEDVQPAAAAIKRYFRENPEAAPAETPRPQKPVKTYTGIWAAGLLAALYGAVATNRAYPLFMERYAASAEKILSGEYYRTVTALMLHADLSHLAGNLIGIALFGTAVCSTLGPAPGWLMILLTGLMGNAANAFLYRAGHVSVGASTSVFGAVGILCAYQFWRRRHHAQKGAKAWLPLAGGLAFLGILGAGGQRVDLMAHLFGFAAGLLLGTVYSLRVNSPLSRKQRMVCWVLTAGILAAAGLRLF